MKIPRLFKRKRKPSTLEERKREIEAYRREIKARLKELKKEGRI